MITEVDESQTEFETIIPEEIKVQQNKPKFTVPLLKLGGVVD